VSSRVENVTCVDSDPLSFILHVFSHSCIESWLVCILGDAMVGSLYVATITVSSAKALVVVSDEVGRSAMYSTYML
jgi:hypothetical protein